MNIGRIEIFGEKDSFTDRMLYSGNRLQDIFPPQREGNSRYRYDPDTEEAPLYGLVDDIIKVEQEKLHIQEEIADILTRKDPDGYDVADQMLTVQEALERGASINPTRETVDEDLLPLLPRKKENFTEQDIDRMVDLLKEYNRQTLQEYELFRNAKEIQTGMPYAYSYGMYGRGVRDDHTYGALLYPDTELGRKAMETLDMDGSEIIELTDNADTKGDLPHTIEADGETHTMTIATHGLDSMRASDELERVVARRKSTWRDFGHPYVDREPEPIIQEPVQAEPPVNTPEEPVMDTSDEMTAYYVQMAQQGGHEAFTAGDDEYTIDVPVRDMNLPDIDPYADRPKDDLMRMDPGPSMDKEDIPDVPPAGPSMQNTPGNGRVPSSERQGNTGRAGMQAGQEPGTAASWDDIYAALRASKNIMITKNGQPISVEEFIADIEKNKPAFEKALTETYRREKEQRMQEENKEKDPNSKEKKDISSKEPEKPSYDPALLAVGEVHLAQGMWQRTAVKQTLIGENKRLPVEVNVPNKYTGRDDIVRFDSNEKGFGTVFINGEEKKLWEMEKYVKNSYAPGALEAATYRRLTQEFDDVKQIPAPKDENGKTVEGLQKYQAYGEAVSALGNSLKKGDGKLFTEHTNLEVKSGKKKEYMIDDKKYSRSEVLRRLSQEAFQHPGNIMEACEESVRRQNGIYERAEEEAKRQKQAENQRIRDEKKKESRLKRKTEKQAEKPEPEKDTNTKSKEKQPASPSQNMPAKDVSRAEIQPEADKSTGMPAKNLSSENQKNTPAMADVSKAPGHNAAMPKMPVMSPTHVAGARLSGPPAKDFQISDENKADLDAMKKIISTYDETRFFGSQQGQPLKFWIDDSVKSTGQETMVTLKTSQTPAGPEISADVQGRLYGDPVFKTISGPELDQLLLAYKDEARDAIEKNCHIDMDKVQAKTTKVKDDEERDR